MSDAWKQWEGQIIDCKFALRRFLASTDHSAVFLTDRGDPSQKLAIKFIQLDEPLAELQLARWKTAANLSHPNLLHLYESGRCRLGEFDLLYVVLEYAEENLSQFLPQRPLTPAETRDVLTPALQALGFLHSEALTHGRIRPSNILAIDDQLKLSSDTIFSIAEAPDAAHPATPLRPSSPYDAPETASGTFSPASDIWSLGMTLVETLTQRLPSFDPASRLDPAVPDALPAVYLDIARQCLRRDPVKRWSVAEVSGRLNPGAVAPAPATASVTSVPVAVEPSPAPMPPAQAAGRESPRVERPRPVAPANPAPIHAQAVAVRSTPRRYDMSPPKLQRPPLIGKLPKFNYLPLIVIGALAFVAILVGPRLLRHSSPVEHADSGEPPTALPAKNSNPPTTTKNSAKQTAKVESGRNSPPPQQKKELAQSQVSPNTVKKASDTQRIAGSANPSISSGTIRPETPKASSGAGFQNGEVLNQVLPDVSSGARGTIRGTVRVAVRLFVDASGNVVRAELASPGPSPYFAEQARLAAEKWDFAPAKADGHAVNSEWLLRFEFKPSDTHAVASQTAP